MFVIKRINIVASPDRFTNDLYFVIDHSSVLFIEDLTSTDYGDDAGWYVSGVEGSVGTMRLRGPFSTEADARSSLVSLLTAASLTTIT